MGFLKFPNAELRIFVSGTVLLTALFASKMLAERGHQATAFYLFLIAYAAGRVIVHELDKRESDNSKLTRDELESRLKN